MQIQRSVNAKRNIIWGLINKIICLLFPFLVRTIIIQKMGAEYLGLNNLFASILQVLSLSELGFSSAIVYSLYKPIAANDTDTICVYMSFYRKAYRIIGTVITSIGIILLPFLRYFISGDVPDGINIYVLYTLYLLNTSIGYFAFAYKNAILNAHQRNDIVSNILTLTQGVMYIGQICILFLFKNYYIYLFIMPLCTTFNNLITAYFANKLYPNYICKGSISSADLKQIKTQIAGLMVHRICQTSRNSLDSIFISAFLGLHVVAVYSNYYYIMNAIIGILSVFSNALVAGVGNSIVIESVEKNYSDFKRINYLYMQIAGWCFICLLVLYQPFMRLWVGENLMFDYKAVVLISLYFYVLKMGDIRGTYSDAAGLWWENRYRAIIESVINVILNAVLVQVCGVYGIIIATLISLFFVNFLSGSKIIFRYYFKGIKPTEFFLLHFKYFIVTSFIATITVLISNKISGNLFINLIGRFLACVFIPGILYLVVYGRTREFSESIGWLLKKLHRKSKVK